MRTKMVAMVAVMTMMVAAAWAGDTSALHPPAGSRMALVVFEDLQCPACASADPLLVQATRDYHLPLVRQSAIYKTNMREWADKFAKQHHTALPAFYDPKGELRAKVEADTKLGVATGVHQTPTIWVVSDSREQPFVEVPDKGKLFETIERVKAALGPAPKAAKKK
jgi:protein-disulfide isomerase